MRSLPLIAACLVIFTAPASAQQQPRLGQRTGSPEQMVARMSPVSPEEEVRALVAAADAHPLGTLENPVRVGGPDGERAYLARLRCADGTRESRSFPARRETRRRSGRGRGWR